MNHDPIAILGSGITAQHVAQFAEKAGIKIVDPSKASLVIASPGIPVGQFYISAPIISETEWA